MRPIGPGDVAAAACALICVPPAVRADVAAQMLERAQAADLYRKRMGRAHPHWGCGSLMDVACQFPAKRAEQFWDDPVYLRCVMVVLGAICDRRGPVGGE